MATKKKVVSKKKSTSAKPNSKAGATKAGAMKAVKAKPSKKPVRASKIAVRGKARASGNSASTKSSAMFQKVAFTMFWVEDPQRARNFYEEVLGFTRGLASSDGTWTEYDLPGGGCLALFRHPNPTFARPSGGASIAFEVADLDALNERLVDAGVNYQGEMIHGPGCRMSNIVDSEGNAIILHQLVRA